MHRNPLVDYLRTYGPLAASDSIYDEHVMRSAKANGVDPLDIGSSLLDEVVGELAGPSPRSIILTGTAGDGKTWHCRKAWLALGGGTADWDGSHGMATMPLPSGKNLVVVKDLSQFHDDHRQEAICTGFVESVTGDTDSVYLLAANDGQLLRFLRRFREGSEATANVEAAVRQMLEGDRRTHPGVRLVMHNLSRQHHSTLFGDIVEAVASHPGWEECSGCRLREERACAILHNLEAVAGTPGMHVRLGQLVQIAAANDMHLPVRHILVLVVNAFLGVSGRKAAMMDCSTAHAIAAEGSHSTSNPYDNVVGLNLKAGENRDYLAFEMVRRAGVGLETNNEIDSLLIDKEPAPLHAARVASDPIHGEALFESLRANYRKGTYDDFAPLQRALETQRRRLFFVLPDTKGAAELDPWRLTVFRHGGEFISFCDDLAAGRQSKHLKSRLVIGLNRSYSGVMSEDSSSLWLTGPAANTQSRVGRILDCEIPLGVDSKGEVCFDFSLEKQGLRPRMSVMARTGFRDPFAEIASHPLSPLLFEYLMRVERGSLPGSFSRQCFEELRQFRLRIMAKLHKMGLADGDDLDGMKVVRLGDDGRLKAETLDVVAPE